MPPLSKSKIIAFRQCPKRLWLEVHRPDLREDSTSTQAVFAIGHQVGAVAKQIYDPSGTGVEVEIVKERLAESFARTKELIKLHRHPIFEAGFKAADALAFADVMLPKGRSSGWKMVEVKSSTSVKDYHRDDVAVQTYIACSAGVSVEEVALACIDTAWTYPGEGDYRGLLWETDLTAEALGRAAEAKSWVEEAQRVAARKTAPDITPGAQCCDPFECGFCAFCNQGHPQPEYPLSWLPRLSSRAREKLAEAGIDDLRKAPDSLLNDAQRRVKKHSITGTEYFDLKGAAKALRGLGFPAYFLDFETIQFAVPIWAGTRPYQQIPFQFSSHKLDRAGNLTQRAFLDLSGGDPSKLFAHALIEACGQSGPVFVYNAGFESGRIQELAGRFPALAKPLQSIRERIVDLLPVARDHYYHPSQQGSWSIKAVLPAAIPELSYESLDGVRDGGAAMAVFAEALNPTTTAERKTEIERQLLAYCGLDTLAMVRLWEFFGGTSCQ